MPSSELPDLVSQVLAQAMVRTQHQTALALVHAVELDRQLHQLGWLEPLTYALHGTVTQQHHTDRHGAPWRESKPGAFACLYQASRGTQSAGQSLATAYAQARGPEIQALNLLYANESIAIDSLWLRFINKYLSHYEVPSSLSLTSGGANRFERLIASPTKTTMFNASPADSQGPLVSVVMPMFNASATLQKATQSILDQTWRNLELILVDDCSQDNSLQIARELQAKDERVKVLTLNTNGGPYVAKNVALSQAKGVYLTVHDADDWAFPTRIAQQMQPLLGADAQGLAVTMGRTLRCDAQGRFTRFQPIDWVSLDGALRLCFPSPLFNRAYFDQKLGAWDSVRVGADAEILQRLRRFEPQKLQVLDTPVMLQLDTQDSLTRQEDTHNDERGEAPLRTAYRQAWSSWHASQSQMPLMRFPQKQRQFQVPETLQIHDHGADELLNP